MRSCAVIHLFCFHSLSHSLSFAHYEGEKKIFAARPVHLGPERRQFACVRGGWEGGGGMLPTTAAERLLPKFHPAFKPESTHTRGYVKVQLVGD